MARKKKISELLAEGGAKEIAPGVTTEKMSPIYIDELIHQPEIIYRLDLKGHRYYFRFQEGEPFFYTSVTTLIRNTLPTSPSLLKWISERGAEEGREEAEERANYGTFLHVCCGELLINKKYDLDKLKDNIQAFVSRNNITPQSYWEEDLKKDILAFAQFMIDRNVKPLAIEIILYNPIDGYAGAIDIVAEMDWQKGRIRALIDIKSGKKGFYESHEIQLMAYRHIWNMHYQDSCPIEKVFNWSPKDWRSSPTYNLKDQSDSKSFAKLPYLVELAKIEESKRENKVVVMSGKIDITKSLTNNIEELTLVQLIKKQKL